MTNRIGRGGNGCPGGRDAFLSEKKIEHRGKRNRKPESFIEQYALFAKSQDEMPDFPAFFLIFYVAALLITAIGNEPLIPLCLPGLFPDEMQPLGSIMRLRIDLDEPSA